MTNMKNIINALPLVAEALGRKYGVKVHIGGQRAYTDGKNIHIPALPLDADDTALNLARGYLDHEAAHLRITDFNALQAAKLSGIERHVWNTLEDFMVESKLSAIYPGCADNFAWLAKEVFLNPDKPPSNSPAENVLDWLLIGIRALAVPELLVEKNKLEQTINAAYPRLIDELEPILKTVLQICSDTKSCISLAKEIVKRIRKYMKEHPQEKGGVQQQDKNKVQEIQAKQSVSEAGSKGDNQSNPQNTVNNQADKSDDAQGSKNPANDSNVPASSEDSSAKSEDMAHYPTLEDLLDDSSAIPEKDMGEMVGKLLEAMGQT